MSEKVILVSVLVAVVAYLGAAIYETRSPTIPPSITTQEVEPGVKCATVVAPVGIALSCWAVERVG